MFLWRIAYSQATQCNRSSHYYFFLAFRVFFQLEHHEPRERSELLKLRHHRKLNLIVKAEEFAEESMGLDTDSFFCPQRQANFGLFQAVDTFLKKSKYKKLTLSYQLKDTYE